LLDFLLVHPDFSAVSWISLIGSQMPIGGTTGRQGLDEGKRASMEEKVEPNNEIKELLYALYQESLNILGDINYAN
jgi:hypothetical protein